MVDRILLKKMLKYIGYGCVFVASFLGTYKVKTKEEKKEGVEKFLKFGIIPLLLLAFIWHTVLYSRGPKITTPYYEIECGGANLGIAVALIISYLLKYDLKSRLCLLTVFLVYMIVALVCHIIYQKQFGSVQKYSTAGFIVLIVYFINKGIILEKNDNKQ